MIRNWCCSHSSVVLTWYSRYSEICYGWQAPTLAPLFGYIATTQAWNCMIKVKQIFSRSSHPHTINKWIQLSELKFSNFISLDAGVYRCVATRSYRGYNSYSGRRETVYMEVDFNPRYNNGYNNINYGRGRDYDTYFNNRYDRYDPYNGYNRPYYQYAKTTEDKAVIDNSLTSEDNKEKKRD